MFFVQKCPVFALVVILFLAVLLCHFLERKCLKIPRFNDRTGSSPVSGTRRRTLFECPSSFIFLSTHLLFLMQNEYEFYIQNVHINVPSLLFDYALTTFEYLPSALLDFLIPSVNHSCINLFLSLNLFVSAIDSSQMLFS